MKLSDAENIAKNFGNTALNPSVNYIYISISEINTPAHHTGTRLHCSHGTWPVTDTAKQVLRTQCASYRGLFRERTEKNSERNRFLVHTSTAADVLCLVHTSTEADVCVR